MLDELADLGLDLCRTLQQRALAAEDAGEAVRFANAFHRVSRGVRQSLALKARLEREARRGLVEDERETRQACERQVAARRKQVQAHLDRVVWDEVEEDEVDDFSAPIERLLDAEQLEDSFITEPLEVLIPRICKALGLDPPPARSAMRGRCPRGAEGVEAHSHFNRPPTPQPP